MKIEPYVLLSASVKCCWLVATAVGLALQPAHAQTAPEVLAYEIPANAIKEGGVRQKAGDVVYWYYLPPNENAKPGEKGARVGAESYLDGVLVSRGMVLNGKLHGVKREWFSILGMDGQRLLKSEEPYRNGTRDGVFRHWNGKHLIGQYQMTAGTGVRKIYNGKGELVEEKHYEHDEKQGLSMNRSSTYISFAWYANGNLSGPTYQFKPDGKLEGISFFTAKGQLHGPVMEFDNNFGKLATDEDALFGFGNIPNGVRKSWYLNGSEVSETEYSEAARNDTTLPPYYADGQQYRKLVPAEVQALLNSYLTAPKVKIPLEFDAKGEPVLAVATEEPKP